MRFWQRKLKTVSTTNKKLVSRNYSLFLLAVAILVLALLANSELQVAASDVVSLSTLTSTSYGDENDDEDDQILYSAFQVILLRSLFNKRENITTYFFFF